MGKCMLCGEIAKGHCVVGKRLADEMEQTRGIRPTDSGGFTTDAWMDETLKRLLAERKSELALEVHNG